jgi:hypothetical protein
MLLLPLPLLQLLLLLLLHLALLPAVAAAAADDVVFAFQSPLSAWPAILLPSTSTAAPGPPMVV